jgi:predicted O-linked N-acetylglucosamine transferase (SPINDLY family)
LANGWHEITLMSRDAVAEMIRAHRIDVLIDLSAHMAGDRLMVLARKPAPVQVSFIGYPATTGLAAIDYRLTDNYLDPVGETEPFNVEKLIRLPKSFYCWLPDGSEPDVAPPPAVRNGYITFGSFNNAAKVSLDAIDLWTRVLDATPTSKLRIVVNEVAEEEHFTSEFARRGVGADRLQLVRPRPRNEYLAFYHDIDIALDPFPYNGGVTTCDALWMGVPVVSLIGQTSVGRAGWSILTNVGLSERVARDGDEYVRDATELARDMQRLAELRGSLRQRMQDSPITDGAGFTRDVEAAYRLMWRAWCASPLG